MGLVLDSGVLIAAERDARPVSELLATLEREHGETEIVLSSITVIELEHGLHRAQTAEQARKRREYLDTVFAAVPVEPFTRAMAQLAAKIDAEARRTGGRSCRSAGPRKESLENRGELRQHFIHDRGGDAFQFLAAACAEIERAGLIAADHARCLGPSARQEHGEPGRPRKVPAAGNGEDYWDFGHVVERLRRNDQDGATALLLMAFGGVESDQPDLTPLH